MDFHQRVHKRRVGVNIGATRRRLAGETSHAL